MDLKEAMEIASSNAADDIRAVEDAMFMKQVAKTLNFSKQYGMQGTITGRINSKGVPVYSLPNYHKDPTGYSEFTIHTMLAKYLIQILSGEENDILQMNDHIKDTLTKWLRCLYHPQANPLREPIKAVKALLEDDEYTLIMIGL